jgi:hypothetical protein
LKALRSYKGYDMDQHPICLAIATTTTIGSSSNVSRTPMYLCLSRSSNTYVALEDSLKR